MSSAPLEGVALLQKLRAVVDPPGVKGTWMRKLSDRQLGEVFQRLVLGHSTYKIVQIVQLDWKMMRNSDPKSLARAVRQFRDSVLTEIEVLQAKSKTKKDAEVSKGLAKQAKKVAGRIDIMGSLGWAILIQQERIQMLYEKEQKALPFKHTDNTIKIFTDMLTQYTEIGLKLGAIERGGMPQQFNVEVNHQFGSMMEKLGQGKPTLVNALDKFLEMATARSQVVELNPETHAYELKPRKALPDGGSSN